MKAVKILLLSNLLLCFRNEIHSQQTCGSIQGIILKGSGEVLPGANLILKNETTGNALFTFSSSKGNYAFPNLKPGGPYTLTISFTGYETSSKAGINVQLGEVTYIDVVLKTLQKDLGNILIQSYRRNPISTFTTKEMNIGREQMDDMPTVGRNIFDLLKTFPQTRTISNNEGAISFAGQNNRFNSFYIDGAINNDIFGLSPSGMNGGQAGISPIALDAIDQIQVNITPYNVSLGNFTGAAIQAITRSGSNRAESSLYHYFSNEGLSGKFSNDRSDPFSTLNSGIRTGGAIVPNKLFYFLNIDFQRDQFSKPNEITNYQGYSNDPSTINILSNTLKTRYHYDPGNMYSHQEWMKADRYVAKIDWIKSKRSAYSFSVRKNIGQRTKTYTSDFNNLQFNNNGYLLTTSNLSGSIECKWVTDKNKTDRFMITFTNVNDHRSPLGDPFPKVRINDGDGAIIIGSDNSSTLNKLNQQSVVVSNKYSYVLGKHIWHLGVEFEYDHVANAFIQNSFGSYSFASLSDFLTNKHPSAYQLGFPFTSDRNEGPDNPIQFSVIRNSYYLSDEWRPKANLIFDMGIRTDKNVFLKTPNTNDFLNDTALPLMSRYWEIENARSGIVPTIPISISPRLGFIWKWQEKEIKVSGGIGMFSGRLPLAWPGGIYLFDGTRTGSFMAERTQLSSIYFRPDAYHQWSLTEIGATLNKGTINLISDKLSLPKQWRASLSIEKKWNNNWTLRMEGIIIRNINEISYRNINLMPANEVAVGPDNRSVYTTNNLGRIPLHPDGSNPFEYVILMGNQQNVKGYTNQLTASLLKYSRQDWNFGFHYSIGKTLSINDGTAHLASSQWRLQETINGKNLPVLSVSDFSPGQKLYVEATKKFHKPGTKRWFSCKFTYSGQTGAGFSYTYDGSMIRDDGIYSPYDLIYIPTQKDIQQMEFLPITSGGIPYSGLQQKEALERFISSNDYLNKQRGNYAARNGSRLQFEQTVDLKIKQEWKCMWGKDEVFFELSFDLFNLGNLINKNWGRKYILPFNNFPLIQFAGYKSYTDLTPTFRFSPDKLSNEPWLLNVSSNPSFSSVWRGQIGLRITYK